MVFQVSQSSETVLVSAVPSPLQPPFKSHEAARYIGMSDSWLRQSRMADRTDGPPFFRAGTRAIRYRRADLDRWLESRLCGIGKEAQPVRIDDEAATRAPTPRARARAKVPKRKRRLATR
jgi:predicted DNA-binding transcriptional regulator AlpA